MKNNYNHKGFNKNRNVNYHKGKNINIDFKTSVDHNGTPCLELRTKDCDEPKYHKGLEWRKKLDQVDDQQVCHGFGVINESATGFDNVRKPASSNSTTDHCHNPKLYTNNTQRVAIVSSNEAKEYFESIDSNVNYIIQTKKKHPHEYLATARYILESYVIKTYDNLKIFDIGAGRRNMCNPNVWSNQPIISAEDNLRALNSLNIIKKFKVSNNCKCRIQECTHIEQFKPDVFLSVDSTYYEGVLDQIFTQAINGISTFAIFNVFDIKNKIAPIICNKVKQGCYIIENNNVTMQVIGNPTPYQHPIHMFNDLYTKDYLYHTVGTQTIKIMKIREFDFGSMKYVLAFITQDVSQSHKINNQQEYISSYLNGEGDLHVNKRVFGGLTITNIDNITMGKQQDTFAFVNIPGIKVAPSIMKEIELNKPVPVVDGKNFTTQLLSLPTSLPFGHYKVATNDNVGGNFYVSINDKEKWAVGNTLDNMYYMSVTDINRIYTKLSLLKHSITPEDIQGCYIVLCAGRSFNVPPELVYRIATAIYVQIVKDREALGNICTEINRNTSNATIEQNQITIANQKLVFDGSDNFYLGIQMQDIKSHAPNYNGSLTKVPVQVMEPIIYRNPTNILQRCYNMIVRRFVPNNLVYQWRHTILSLIPSLSTFIYSSAYNNDILKYLTVIFETITVLYSYCYGARKYNKTPRLLDIVPRNENAKQLVESVPENKMAEYISKGNMMGYAKTINQTNPTEDDYSDDWDSDSDC